MKPDERPAIVMRPGEWVLTEHKGRFYAVGNVHFGPDSIGSREARCCQNGHDNPDDVEDCWGS